MSTVTGDPVEPAALATADEPGTAPGDRRFRPDVEGLRAVAVVLVVLYHADLRGLSGGFVGVDVFFVISGFVITGLLLREREASGSTSLVSFYGRRARRILPAATLVIVTVVIATYAVLGVYYGDPTAITARWTSVFLANFHFAATGTNYLTATQPPSPLQNFWSLAVEEQFYLVFPAIVLVAASLRSRVSVRARLTAVLLPIILLSFLLSAVQTGTDPSTAYFSPLTRAWELALGALVAVATPSLLRLHRHAAAAMTWAGLAAIAYAAVAYSSATSYPGTAVAVPVVGTALVIAGGAPVPRWGAESVLRLGPFQWFGRLSYSLYLWHWPILILAAESASSFSLPFRSNIVWLLVSVAAAYVTYRLVENPIRHAALWSGRRWLPLAAGAALIATSLVVATVGLAVQPTPSSSSAGRAVVPLTPAELKHEVAAAVHITSLPADLAPSLAGVRTDWGGPTAPCWPSYGQSTVGRCLFGDPNGTRTMVLYGDSHAAMWFDTMDDLAYLLGWKLLILAKGDCPVLDLPFADPAGYGSPDGTFTACTQWHRFALQRIAEVHPTLVIVTEDADLGPGDRHYSPDTWQAAMVHTIHELPVPASEVVVLGNIPQLTQGGPDCLSLNPHAVQRCSGPNLPYTAEHTDAEKRAAAQAGAHFVDTTPWFCSTTCTDVIGRYQPYWDPYHVTNTYAHVLGPTLLQALAAVLHPPAEAPATTTSGPGSAG